MFSIFNKKRNKVFFPFEKLGTDMHSHLVPGIDDGSPDVETSIQLIRGMVDLGYKKLITTPHVMEDMYRNDPESIFTAFRILEKEMEREKLSVFIKPAAEYLLDGNVDEILEKKGLLLTLTGNFVLVEISFVSPPFHLKDVIFELQINGYQPILAHPERYSFYHHQPRQYEEIKAMGCLLQANLLSFAGYYGSDVMQAAEMLSKKGLIDLLGTDLHHERHLHHLRELVYTPALARLVEEKGMLNAEL
jgi:tyrosine-protein phosphatase YwqE